MYRQREGNEKDKVHIASAGIQISLNSQLKLNHQELS